LVLLPFLGTTICDETSLVDVLFIRNKNVFNLHFCSVHNNISLFL
jgi:hypothetical protein